MATDKIKARRIRQIGERFVDPKYGEILVIDRANCDGCVCLSKRNNGDLACHAPGRLELTGSCITHERPDRTSVQFVKPEDYAVFKLTGEWP